MKINLKNYEEYFVRHIDDELSRDEVNDLNLFLKEHPELKQELEAFRLVILPAEEEILFKGKEKLKKGITAANRDEYLIRKIEGQLSAEEEIELAQFLQFNQQFNRDLKAFEATKLSADSSIVFPDKKSLLKREGRVIPIGVRYLLVAAVAASLFVVMLMKGIQWNQPLTNSQTARENQSEIKGKGEIEGEEKNGISNKGENESVASDKKEEKLAAKNNSSEKKSQKRNEKKNAPTLLADATLHNSSDKDHSNVSNEFTGETKDELMPIATGDNGIYYLPRQKKAMYRENSEVPAKFASERNSGTVGSFAANLGSDILRLTGRGDYLPASANEQKEKQPVALNISGERFGFSTTLFKKRADKNPSTEKTKTVL